LAALVAVTISFEAIEGGDMEGVEAVGNLRNASAGFFFGGRRWRTTGKAIFNLNPGEAIGHLKGEYERPPLDQRPPQKRERSGGATAPPGGGGDGCAGRWSGGQPAFSPTRIPPWGVGPPPVLGLGWMRGNLRRVPARRGRSPAAKRHAVGHSGISNLYTLPFL